MILITKNKEIHTVTKFKLDNWTGLEIRDDHSNYFTIQDYETREEAQKVLESIADTVATQGHNAVIIL